MKKTNKNQEKDNLIGEKLEEAFGYAQEQLIEEFDRAAKELDGIKLQAPEGEFDKILTKYKKAKKEK